MTDQAQRIALWTLALLLVAGTGLGLRFARGYRPLAGLASDAPLFPADIGIRFEGISVVGRDRDRPAWTLKAGRVEITRSRNRVLFSDGIEAALLPGQGKPAATITAPTAFYDNIRRALSVSGPIVCRLGDLRIATADLSWDAGSDLVRCPGLVRATYPRAEVNGERLSVNIRTHEYSLRNVHARFRVDEAQDALR